MVKGPSYLICLKSVRGQNGVKVRGFSRNISGGGVQRVFKVLRCLKCQKGHEGKKSLPDLWG